MGVTIDTNILVNAYNNMEPDHLAVVTQFGVRNNLYINFDHNNVIFRQYENEVGSREGYRKWYKRLLDMKKIYLCSGQLPARHRRKLETVGCHEPSDHVFIGTAFNSDRILITEDSDMGKGPNGNIPPHDIALEYLTETMELQVFDAEEYLETFASV